MRKFIFLCILVYGMVFGAFSVSAQEMLRVGLESVCNHVQQVNIGNNKISIGISADGNFISDAVIEGTQLNVKPLNGGYIISGVFNDFVSASQYLKNSNKVNSVPVFLGLNKWSIADLSGGGNVGANAVIIYDGSNPIMISDCEYMLQIKGYDDTIINSKKYRGVIELYKSANSITAVNVIDIEEYLYGVVASEMPFSWHIEALKAQATAARSYAVSMIEKHKEKGYDVCDTVDCQVYKGIEGEEETVKTAVNETKGKLIYYDNQVINAVFFSSSGGSTAAAEDVWGTRFEYLKPVKEINENEAKEWTRTFTYLEISQILSRNNINIGNIENIFISETDKYSRVNALTIKGTEGEKILKNEEVRTFFSSTIGGSLDSRNFVIGGVSSVSQSNTLNALSENASEFVKLADVYVADVNNKPQNISNKSIYVLGQEGQKEYNVNNISVTVDKVIPNNTLVISGKGWGHGVGMSQFGAKGMAEAGHSYIEILKYYYTNVEVM